MHCKYIYLQCRKRRDLVSLIEIYIGTASCKIFNIKSGVRLYFIILLNYCPIIFVYDSF